MIVVIKFMLLAVSRYFVIHDSHVVYHWKLSTVSCFCLSSVAIFSICRRKGLISSSPCIQSVYLEIQWIFSWLRCRVSGGGSCKVSVGLLGRGFVAIFGEASTGILFIDLWIVWCWYTGGTLPLWLRVLWSSYPFDRYEDNLNELRRYWRSPV